MMRLCKMYKIHFEIQKRKPERIEFSLDKRERQVINFEAKKREPVKLSITDKLKLDFNK